MEYLQRGLFDEPEEKKYITFDDLVFKPWFNTGRKYAVERWGWVAELRIVETGVGTHNISVTPMVGGQWSKKGLTREQVTELMIKSQDNGRYREE